jgi:hypothetical protein
MVLDFERKTLEEKRGNHSSRSEKQSLGTILVAGLGSQFKQYVELRRKLLPPKDCGRSDPPI